jgi:GNAT superfamily N-acetyltransferase
MQESSPLQVEIHSLTPDRWSDLETLFGEKGAVGGCWCMWWCMNGREYNANKGSNNRESLKRIVESGDVPGLLAYHEDRPVGWVSIAPREGFAARFNNRSPMFKPIDDLPVWSIVCYFIDKDYRHSGVATALLQSALQFAKDNGAQLVEAYPKETTPQHMTDNFLYTGTLAMYRAAGFVEAAKRQTTMTLYIMRKILDE